MLGFLRKIIPTPVMSAYHKFIAIFASFWYGNPSKKMVVIGVTGTNGKSTTVNVIGRMLDSIGGKVGFTSTVNFKVAEKEWLNDKKMTMLGRFALQKLLADMVRAGCVYAVVETSSEGLRQFRHLGINYDIAVFLNLTPEHIESHGGFENYKKAKAELFFHLTKKPRKKFNESEIPKMIVANLDSEYAAYFLDFKADRKFGFSISQHGGATVDEELHAEGIEVGPEGSKFLVNNVPFSIKLPGAWNVSNVLAAVAVGRALGLPLTQIRDAVSDVKGIPGRMEFINEGQAFKVLVDYAPQPQSMLPLYEFLKSVHSGRIIHLLGSAGGGRDKSRRPILGEIAGKNADIVIVSNEDPYDEDPMQIIDEVAAGAVKAGKKDEENLFRILDRHEAVRYAISLAKEGDLVLVTGKGAEQAIVVKNRKKIPWDEREEARRAIRELK